MIERQEWTARAEPAEVPRLRGAVSDFVRRHPVDARVVENVRLCVTEAVTNALLHAFRTTDEPGTVVVSAEMEEHRLVVHVVDDGGGFAPRPDSPGLGLGLALMGRLSSSLAVTESAAGGTDVRMAFDLAREGARAG